MQVIRLIESGYVDKIIAFDELPKRMLAGVPTKSLAGFPKYWSTWMRENGSEHEVERWNPVSKSKDKFMETFTYVLDYKDINNDKEKWSEINTYVRRVVDLSVRLKDKLEDMAAPLAADSYTELTLDVEDIPVIKINTEAPKVEEKEALAGPKRRGRPKKVAVEA